MRILITGSAGHLGEALMRLAPGFDHDVVGLDLTSGPFTHVQGSVTDAAVVAEAMEGVDAVLHTATLHKPHVATHSRQDFIDTNVTGTLTVLEQAARRGVKRMVFTSTTSTFGDALRPPPGAPAAWITEDVAPIPKNIYGATKCAAEDLCQLFARNHGMTVTVLRTSRFFPEADDDPDMRAAYGDENAKANEFLHRRVDVADAATAHFAALSSDTPFARYIISATTPFTRDDLPALRKTPDAIVAARFPRFVQIYADRGYRMFGDIGRVYVNTAARQRLRWRPAHDFARILGQLEEGAPIGSDLSRIIGAKGYHDRDFDDGPYPLETS